MIREDLQACASPIDPQIYASLDKVAQAARHQARMIEALMELSRIGRAPLEIAAVPLASLVTELQVALGPTLQGREVSGCCRMIFRQSPPTRCCCAGCCAICWTTP